jgi:hypothetical protein
MMSDENPLPLEETPTENDPSTSVPADRLSGSGCSLQTY